MVAIFVSLLFMRNVLRGLPKCVLSRNIRGMPTYIYETVEEPYERFEIKQSMKDEPLKRHPETGVPVRRVISGGYGIMVKKAPALAPCGEAKSCCGPACGCGCGHAF
jgi:predicted nucleic acid-binding Zn ribbon protein